MTNCGAGAEPPSAWRLPPSCSATGCACCWAWSPAACWRWAASASHYSWSYGNDSATLYLAWMLALGVWLGAHWLQKNSYDDGVGAPVAAYIESVSTGWVLAILLGLASWSGKTFMLERQRRRRPDAATWPMS